MRALISVYNKDKIVDFAKKLVEKNWEIISTGGTYKILKEENIPVKEVSEITNSKEILSGRVKTLHPKIHGAILYRRENKEDLKTVKEENIGSIDMVVNNLYPFEESLNANKSHDEMIENIDIGGPSMIRAAAKNYKFVYIVTDPKDYDKVIEKIDDDDFEFRRYLAKKAFNLTAHYDSLIANYFNEFDIEEFPRYINKSYELKDMLRYGENPHQKAAFYEDSFKKYNVKYNKLHGKEISYNNLNDMYAAIKAIKEFKNPAAVAIKHTNPCGIAEADSLEMAFKKAYECDSESIFGGIVALNREVDIETAKKLSEIFLEIIVAPKFSEEAFNLLSKKKNIRLIEMKDLNEFKIKHLTEKEVLNGILVQERDDILYNEEKLEVVTKRFPTVDELEELKFAFKCVKSSASNSVVVAKDKGTLGIGQGQTKRSWAVEEAIERAGDKIKGAVFASDGFFFVDTMEFLNKAGIKAIIQPGGSVKDKDVIKYADENDMSIVFTHIRHFRH